MWRGGTVQTKTHDPHKQPPYERCTLAAHLEGHHRNPNIWHFVLTCVGELLGPACQVLAYLLNAGRDAEQLGREALGSAQGGPWQWRPKCLPSSGGHKPAWRAGAGCQSPEEKCAPVPK